MAGENKVVSRWQVLQLINGYRVVILMVIQERLDKAVIAGLMAPMFAKHVRNIPLRIQVSNGDKSLGDEGFNEVKAQNLVPLIQASVWYRGAHDLRFVVSPHVAGLIDRRS